ncbi:MAG: response regulator [candidate division KSB1 bacterium]|nr:response regulator [candidate division KSB1 bacterium]MDZ7366248.1 response regulator [candidate division KSB1 bacterium]MDZ7404466.1 response regulator [candidate division KSB1 bacterium]
MNRSRAILICDRDPLFREALRNFLLAAGYVQVEVVTTGREALALLRRERFGCVLIGMSRPFLHEKRLATIARRRQPNAKIFVLVAAAEQPFIRDTSFEYLVKEQIFSNIIALLEEHEPGGEA